MEAPYENSKNMEEGSKIHEALAKKWSQVSGRICEEKQVNYLYLDTGNQSKIEGILEGTPDMFWFEKGILFVVDHKTTADSLKKPTSAHWNQLSYYGTMILNNFCGGTAPFVLKVVLAVWIYGRKRTISESIKNIIYTSEMEIKPQDWIKKVTRHLQTRLSQPFQLAPASRGFVI